MALVLMLVGALAVSGIVQAQSGGNRIISIGDDNIEGNTHVAYFKASELDAADSIEDGNASGGDLIVAAIDIPENATDDIVATPKDESEDGLNISTADGATAEAVATYELAGADAKYFHVDIADGEVRIKDDASELYLKDATKKGVFNFNVRIYVDTDTATDGNDDGDEDDDDKDEVNTLSVTVYALKYDTAADNNLYGTIPLSSIAGDLVMGLGSDGKGYSKGVGIADLPEDAVVTVAGSDTTWEAEKDAQDVVWIKYAASPEDGIDEGGEADEPYDGTSDSFTFTLTIDPDGVPAIDAPANAEPIVLDGFAANIRLFSVLSFAPLGANVEAKSFSVRNNAAMGTQIGSIAISGSFADDTSTTEDDEGESIDFLIVGNVPFNVEPRMSVNRVSHAVITVDGDLASMAQSEPYSFVVTANGRLTPTRTDEIPVEVTITASNMAPSIVDSNYDSTDNLLTASASEDDDGAAVVIEEDSVLYDFGDSFSDPTNDTLTYGIRNAPTGFSLDTATGVLKVTADDIDASAPQTALEEDIDDTPVDESLVYFMSPGTSKFANGTNLSNDMNADFYYEFVITASDRANTLIVPVKLWIDVNDKPMVDSTDEDSDGVFQATYETTDPFGTTIFDIGAVVDDEDESDSELDYTDWEITGPEGHAPATFTINGSGVVQLNFPGFVRGSAPDWDNTWDITVTIDDGFENTPISVDEDGDPLVDEDDDPTGERDADAVLKITITVIEGEAPRRVPHEIDVEEHTAIDTVVGSVSGLIEGVDEYSEVAGSDGSTHFDVDETSGDITIKSDLDADAADADTTMLLSVKAFGSNQVELGEVSVLITITGKNEAPSFADDADDSAYVAEDAQDTHVVMTGNLEDDVAYQVTASDPESDSLSYSIRGSDGKAVPFAIDSDGKVTVSGNNALDHEAIGAFDVVITASDGTLSDTLDVTIEIGNSNEAPYYVTPQLAVTIPESLAAGSNVLTSDTDGDKAAGDRYVAEDADGDVLEFTIKTQTDTGHFALDPMTGVLTVGTGPGLDYETQQTYLVEINVSDPDEAEAEIQLLVTVTNVNDESPKFGVVPPVTSVSVPENTARGIFLANYGAADADGDTVKYSLKGANAKSFTISQTGDLMTLESLDADSGTPCGAVNCEVIVVANDMPDAESGTPTLEHGGAEEATVRITVTEVEDSISIPHITKANPVPGVGMGKSGSALAGLKVIGDEYLWDMLDCPRMLDLVNSSDKSIYCKMWDGLSTKAKGVVSAKLSAPEESPSDLPATYGDEGKGPKNFVETEWGNWGTVLRIEVTAESPDATCGVDVGVATRNNNQCVELIVKSDSADDVIHLAAYRSNEQENRYVAAVMLVELEAHASNYVLSSGGDEVRTPIYRHQRVRNVVPSAAKTDYALQVPRLQADEEDEIEIEFHNLRTDIDVENEPPEISNVSPEHEAAFDDADVEYTFSVSDDNSGLPEPEDLPDANGDEDYTPVVGLVSDRQCVIDDPDDGILARAIHIHESEYLDCGDNAQDGEYIANEGGWGFAPIRDDRDFDETSDGFDVETTLVLVKNEIFYVTFIACDRAGNCASYDPDGNDNDVELAKITIDTEVPEFVEARTGVKWDSSDNEYGDDRSFIQVIFDDLTPLNEETVESDDFVVEGHTVKAVYIYSPDDEDTLWADENSDGTLNEDTDPTRYAKGGPSSEWGDGGALYRKIDRTVFLELEDELLADETPDVTIIPNGVEDQAGNEQDDGDVEAKDWIAPRFVVVSIVAADTPEGASNQLAGDGDEVTVMVTSDERLDQTRPTVTVTYVDASMVDTKGTAKCGTDGKRKRGEITTNTAGKTSTDCADNALATGDELNNHIEKITNTEWMVTVTEPKATGYYNFHIKGVDRSPKKNEGSEGVGADEIVTEFFDSDGDVNSDDAVFWEADINLPNPNIRVSGMAVTDNEASVEYRSPLFVEIDFTINHWIDVDCEDVETDDRMANCMNENSEYSEDNFDDVVVTMFQLDGVDMTDSVKTTDSQTFLVSLESVSIGDHTVLIQGIDQAGNILEDTLEIDFEVNDRDPFEKRLSPGWNLVSLPGEPANSNIASVFGSDVEVRTVYTYDPVIPGGWMVAVRETLESDWQGDLTEISGQRGYWVLSDAIQDWEVSIPRLAGGSAGTGTPIQPPVIALYAGWNLIPVIDISGDGAGGDTIRADVYLEKLGDGLDLARVLGFNTIRNQWQTVLDPGMPMNNTLEIGSAYWIFVREAGSLVPSGFVGGGGGGD